MKDNTQKRIILIPKYNLIRYYWYLFKIEFSNVVEILFHHSSIFHVINHDCKYDCINDLGK